MAGLDERFLTTETLESYFVDKNTGQPLAGGSVYFYRDVQRSVAKPVYQLTGDPGNNGQDYSYAALPNPLTLSGTGTFVDSSGNEVAVYYYPYVGLPTDNNPTVDLYYIVVVDQFGNPQFTRQAWPTISGSTNPLNVPGENTDNQITNPQFIESYLTPDVTQKFKFVSSGTFNYLIAPDWVLQVIAGGSGEVDVILNSIQGTRNLPTNPSYSLEITPGTNINDLYLIQTLAGTGSIWTQDYANKGGYISGGALIAPGSSLRMDYVPSVPTIGGNTMIFSTKNEDTNWLFFSGTVQLPQSTNTAGGVNGYVNIKLTLPTTSVTEFTSIQLLGLESKEEDLPYIQDTPARQRDYLYHYYKDGLAFKPIPSYLIGWDFLLNPAQIYGDTYNPAFAGSGSYYVWDQTIVYQSVANSLQFNRSNRGKSFQINCLADTNLAIVQYLPVDKALEILNNDEFSLNVELFTDQSISINGNIAVFYTSGQTLPAIGSNLSIVGSLNSDGSLSAGSTNPCTGTGTLTWTKVTRPSFGYDASFTFNENSTPLTEQFSTYGFNGFSVTDLNARNDTTWVAVVVSFSTLKTTQNIIIKSISLVPGSIPTVPAPQTKESVLAECQRFYQMTYADPNQKGVATLNGVKINALPYQYNSGSGLTSYTAGTFEINFRNKMDASSPVIDLYSTSAGTKNRISWYYTTTGGTPTTGSDLLQSNYVATINNYSILFAPNSASMPSFNPGGTANTVNGYIAYQYTLNGLLGTF